MSHVSRASARKNKSHMSARTLEETKSITLLPKIVSFINCSSLASHVRAAFGKITGKAKRFLNRVRPNFAIPSLSLSRHVPREIAKRTLAAFREAEKWRKNGNNLGTSNPNHKLFPILRFYEIKKSRKNSKRTRKRERERERERKGMRAGTKYSRAYFAFGASTLRKESDPPIIPWIIQSRSSRAAVEPLRNCAVKSPAGDARSRGKRRITMIVSFVARRRTCEPRTCIFRVVADSISNNVVTRSAPPILPSPSPTDRKRCAATKRSRRLRRPPPPTETTLKGEGIPHPTPLLAGRPAAGGDTRQSLTLET